MNKKIYYSGEALLNNAKEILPLIESQYSKLIIKNLLATIPEKKKILAMKSEAYNQDKIIQTLGEIVYLTQEISCMEEELYSYFPKN